MNPTEERFHRLWKEAERAAQRAIPKWAGFASREEREDILQAVRIKAWRAFDSYDDRGLFAFWVCRIARNESLNRGKRTACGLVLVPIEDWQGVDDSPSPFDVASREDLFPEMEAALASLPEEFRTTLLHVSDGLSYDEVAERMGVPVGTVRSRIFRARDRMVAALQPA